MTIEFGFFCLAVAAFAFILYTHRREKKRLITLCESLGIYDLRRGDELEPELLIGQWGSIPVHVLYRHPGKRRGIETTSMGLGIPNTRQLSIEASSAEIRELISSGLNEIDSGENFRVYSDDPDMARAVLQDSRCKELLSSYIRRPEDCVVMKECMIKAVRRGKRVRFDELREVLSEQFTLVQAIRAALEPVTRVMKADSVSSSVCPFCRDALATTYSVECSACKTRYHDICWTQNGGCAVFGCHGMPLQIVSSTSGKEKER